MLRTGFILNRRDDAIWFLGLPFVAVAAALASQQWLPFVALASVNLWITVPHHFATWARTYGLRDDWERFKSQLVIGPAVIVFASFLGLMWAPVTLFALVLLWDTQHTIMQQHGFARIYDFKAKTGAPSTRKFDFGLHWVLYGNLFLTAPVFSTLWIRESYRWHLPVSPEFVRAIQVISWSVLAIYSVVYIGHVLWSLRQGHAINPVKYFFIAASYFLWYFTAWLTASVLVLGIAHRLMHGLQYIVMVYTYLRRRAKVPDDDAAPSPPRPTDLGLRVTRSAKVFLLACGAYAILYQLMLAQPLEDFIFGAVDLSNVYEAIPNFGLQAMSTESGYQLFAAVMIESFALTHYYVDSFIWKVRDKQVQRGL